MTFSVVFFCGVQNQDVVPISSYDTAGSFLILGCNNGSIYYIGESQLGSEYERTSHPGIR